MAGPSRVKRSSEGGAKENGERRYAGVWRVGPSGAFYASRAQDFGKVSNDLRATQQLIDFERYTREDDGAMQIGVCEDGDRMGESVRHAGVGDATSGSRCSRVVKVISGEVFVKLPKPS